MSYYCPGTQGFRHIECLNLHEENDRVIAGRRYIHPLTGRFGERNLRRFMEDNSANPDIQRFLAHLSLRSQKRALATNLNTFPYNSLYGTVESEVVWRVWLDSDSNPQVINSGNVTQVPGTGRYRLYCDVPSFDKDNFHRYVNDYLKFPEAEELVVFLKRAIATPKAPFVPGLPFFLLVSKDFRCYESAIGKFLDPIQLHSRQRFGWWIEGAPTNAVFEKTIGQTEIRKAMHYHGEQMAKATAIKAVGNLAYGARRAPLAIMRFTEAQTYLEEAKDRYEEKIDNEYKRRFSRLYSIVLSNLAAAYLLPGESRNISLAFGNARKAILADPSYPKGYLRLARAHQANNDLSNAQRAIAEALRRPDLRNEIGLVETLIDLQTGGKGLPKDYEAFKRMAQNILHDDRESAIRVKDIGGLWRERMNRSS
ncbi:hypothetical protein DFP72DRAFT_225175 [Ephemerocybe angulata]|uniref:Tetratricopeptide repeat protein n=1 Tax=Ephemerocybe angulata TaxID=980116 RepID=A0A8H6I2X0_9AGAR|nr:hypothetical protein DFP72DRAFT_225175 [Tulosesus angulatus]